MKQKPKPHDGGEERAGGRGERERKGVGQTEKGNEEKGEKLAVREKRRKS